MKDIDMKATPKRTSGQQATVAATAAQQDMRLTRMGCADAYTGHAAGLGALDQSPRRTPGSDALHAGAFAVSPDMSMTPTFGEGDLLEVDTRYDKVTREGIYAFELRGSQFVRRMVRDYSGDGSIQMLCDNKVFQSLRISPTEARGLKVFGRVVRAWAAHRL
jgi:phage repressor protein C with HTH and peptisase S24 domain